MSGFYRGMKGESNEKIKEHMLDYVINLLDDANDFSMGLCLGQSRGLTLQNGAGGK